MASTNMIARFETRLIEQGETLNAKFNIQLWLAGGIGALLLVLFGYLLSQ